MDGSLSTWKTEHRLSQRHDHLFMLEYQDAMRNITQEFAQWDRGQLAIDLITKEFPVREDGKKRNPERTWKSFLLQEVEYTSLQAKIKVANKYDGYGSLEHD